MSFYAAVKFLHVVAAVVLAGLLFSLVVASQPLGARDDDNCLHQYLESLVVRNLSLALAVLGVLSSAGVSLALLRGVGPSASPSVAIKLILVLAIAAALIYVRFRIQPETRRLLERAGDGLRVPRPLLGVIEPLRARRRRLLAGCLFLEIVAVLMAVQILRPLPILASLALAVLSGLLMWALVRVAAVFERI